MTYRTDNKIKRYVKVYEFMSFAKTLGNEYGKKIMNKGRSSISKFNQNKYGKIGNEFGKIAGKKILTKSAEATGNLIGSKIADKIISYKSKPKEKIEEDEEIIISPDKTQQILNDLRLF